MSQSLGQSFYYFSSLFALSSTVVLAIFLYLKDRRKGIHRLYALFLLSLGLWILGDIFYLSPLVNTLTPLFWMKLSYCGAVFCPTFLLHFIFVFTQTKPFRHSLVFVYLLSTLLLVFNIFTPFFFTHIFYNTSTRLLEIQTAPVYTIFSIYVLVSLFIGFFFVLRTYYKKTGLAKKRAKYFLFATSMIVLAAISYFPAMIFNLHTLRFDNLFLLVFELIIAFAILKTELMDIKQFVSKSLSFGITLTLIVLSFVLSRSLITGDFFWSGFVLTLVWAMIANPFYKWIQSPIKSKFVTHWYTTDLLLDQISVGLKEARSNSDVVRLIGPILIEKMGVSQVECYSWDSQLKQFVNHYNDELYIDSQHFLVMPYQKDPSLAKSKRAKEFDKDHYDELKRLCTNCKLVVPFSSKTGVEIILFLGPKQNLDDYSDLDMATCNQLIRMLWFHFSLRAPLEAVEEQLQMKDAQVKDIHDLAAFGTLTKSIAHEIKNPLNMMYGNFELILEQCRDHIEDSNLLELSQATLLATERLDKTIKMMLHLGRGESVDMQEIDVHEALLNVIRLARHTCRKENIELKESFEFEGKMNGNHVLIEQIMTNLLVNSVEALKEERKNNPNKKGLITFETKEVSFKQQGIIKHGLCICLKDNGPGIPETKQKDIFKAFSSNKYGNMGLGLSIVLQHMHILGGELQLTSKPGESVFYLYFPRVMTAAHVT